MQPIPPPGPPKNSNQFARDRDERICWMLDSHPVTAALLVAIGLSPARARRSSRSTVLSSKSASKVVGVVCRTSGRPEYVYCRWRPQALLHEIELAIQTDAANTTRQLLLIHGSANSDSIVRAPGLATA
jgi:hypothetical protein